VPINTVTGAEYVEYKLYAIVPRAAMQLMEPHPGKLASQAGHAFMDAFWDSEQRFAPAAAAYRAKGSSHPKITLLVETEAELRALHAAYYSLCGVAVVVDEGRTVFNQPTLTALGLGPIHPKLIGPKLADLELLKKLEDCRAPV
jgi:peptidyl-tRNA hydrolase